MSEVEPARLPLAGVRVVEFSHVVMGPACGVVLADLGADVVKVEPPSGGDKTRTPRGAERRALHHVQPEQAERRRRRPRTRRSLLHSASGRAGRRPDRELPPRRARRGRAGLRLAQRRDASPRLLLAEGFSLGPVRASGRPRRGRADDGRPRLHDRSSRAAAPGRCVRQRPHGRRLRGRRRSSPRSTSASRRAVGCSSRPGSSRTTHFSSRSTWPGLRSRVRRRRRCP